MRPQVILLPVLSAILVSGWVIPQSRRLREANGELARLKVEEKARRARVHDPVGDGKPDPMTVDWSTVAKDLAATTNNDPSRKSRWKTYRMRIDAMSEDEILRLLDQAGGLSIESQEKIRFESFLCTTLEERVPLRLLGRFRSQAGDDRFAHRARMLSSLTKAAEQDPEEARAWLDEIISDGVFDSSAAGDHNRSWCDFEAALVCGLIKCHPVMAEERLAGLPRDLATEILRFRMFFVHTWNPEQVAGYGRIVRKFLPADEVLDVVLNHARGSMGSGGLQRASSILDAYVATPVERTRVAARIAHDYIPYVARSRPPTLDDVDAAVDWASGQGVKHSAGVEGASLAAASPSPKIGLDRAFNEIIRRHEKSPNDELIVRFLGWPVVWKDPERCRELASRIVNERLRADCMKKP